MPETITKARTSVDAFSKLLLKTLKAEEVEKIARDCGWLKRIREVSPIGMLTALLSTLGAGNANWLADILRTFNAFTGKNIQYKPFHNQLRKAEFPEFVRRILSRVLSKLAVPVLKSIPGGKLSSFVDIILHDGTSFAMKDALAKRWPGRFTKVSPSAVELHVSMSALEDSPLQIELAPDKESERNFTPTPASCQGCLLLEDRGYECCNFFREVQVAGGFYIVRGKKNIKPTIRKATGSQNTPLKKLEGKRLSWRILPAETVDLDIEWKVDGKVYHGRLVAIYKRGRHNKKTYVYLHTNLKRSLFSTAAVGRLYRLRWQIELLFKEWKSHANLHAFDTTQEHIAEALIWASLLAATLKRALTHAAQHILQVELSTQRAASSAKHFLDGILRCLLAGSPNLSSVFEQILKFLDGNARRAHPQRDRKTGRLAPGLCPVGLS